MERNTNGVRLVAIDLDGTLLTPGGELPPEGSRRIREAADGGIHVVIVTTRSMVYTRGICRRLGLDGVVVCSNGAEIFDSPNGSLLVHRRIPLATARRIAELADRSRWRLWITFGNGARVTRTEGDARDRPHVTLVDSNIDAMTEEPVSIFAGNPDAIRELEKLCGSDSGCRTEIYYSSEAVAESIGIFAHRADKGTALRYVAERLGVDRSKVMAIGDNINDIPMLRFAGISVAMGNATSAVRKAASAVAPSNAREGVAWAFDTLI